MFVQVCASDAEASCLDSRPAYVAIRCEVQPTSDARNKSAARASVRIEDPLKIGMDSNFEYANSAVVSPLSGPREINDLAHRHNGWHHYKASDGHATKPLTNCISKLESLMQFTLLSFSVTSRIQCHKRRHSTPL